MITETAEIVKELEAAAKLLDFKEVDALVKAIQEADRIFIAGVGRSGFVARAFANRLMHLGMQVYVVGDSTTPAIRQTDLLVISSGSGETQSLVVMAKKANEIGACIATVTIFPQGSIGTLATHMVQIPGATPKGIQKNTYSSIQPMGNLFEQLSWLIYDSIVMILMKETDTTTEEMFHLHANLE